MPPGHLARIVAGHARSADLGAHGINRARGCDTDVAHQRRTAIALTAHAPQFLIDEGARNAIEIGVGLEREPGPLRRIGAARAAGATCVGILVICHDGFRLCFGACLFRKPVPAFRDHALGAREPTQRASAACSSVHSMFGESQNVRLARREGVTARLSGQMSMVARYPATVAFARRAAVARWTAIIRLPVTRPICSPLRRRRKPPSAETIKIIRSHERRISVDEGRAIH